MNVWLVKLEGRAVNGADDLIADWLGCACRGFFSLSLFETRDRERGRQERVRIQVTYFHLESFLEAMSTYLPTCLPTYCPLAV